MDFKLRYLWDRVNVYVLNKSNIDTVPMGVCQMVKISVV